MKMAEKQGQNGLSDRKNAMCLFSHGYSTLFVHSNSDILKTVCLIKQSSGSVLRHKEGR